jgi:hypothetical protein
MLDFRQLALLSNQELGRYDIVATHLACAAGMPGSDKIDLGRCIKAIEKLVPWVRQYTDHVLANPDPADAGETEAQQRMRCLVTVLWRGANIRYNPAKIPLEAPLCLEDTFIHGALFGDGGTCASLPVLYTAVGRRLRYPLKLVSSWGPKACHLFCRWDDPAGECFNVEGNETGVGCFPDDHYREHGQDPHHEKIGRYLVSQTPREEVAGFIKQRAHGWLDVNNRRLAVDAFALAAAMCPDNEFYLNTAKTEYNRWLDEVVRPPNFPEVRLNVHRRRFPDGLPFDLERDILCLEAIETTLKDPALESRWWASLRNGRWRTMRTPRVMGVDSWGNRVSITFVF